MNVLQSDQLVTNLFRYRSERLDLKRLFICLLLKQSSL